jgi:hypothetical protein
MTLVRTWYGIGKGAQPAVDAELKEAIRAARTRGLSVAYIAAVLGVHRTTVYRATQESPRS